MSEHEASAAAVSFLSILNLFHNKTSYFLQQVCSDRIDCYCSPTPHTYCLVRNKDDKDNKRTKRVAPH